MIEKPSPTFNLVEFSKKISDYCVIVPVINEGVKFQKQIKKMKKYSKIVDIIVADGGSSDGSTGKTFLKKNKVRTLLVKTSPGKLGTQLRIAFSYALKQKYAGIITIDGNGKDSVSSIPKFIKQLENGLDYVQGSRFIKGGKHINTPTQRYVGIRFILSPILSFAAKKWYTDVTNGFRGYSSKLLSDKKLGLFRNIFVSYEILFYITARANKLGYKTQEIPVTRKYPKGKIPTKIIGLKNNIKLITTSLRMVTNHYNP